MSDYTTIAPITVPLSEYTPDWLNLEEFSSDEAPRFKVGASVRMTLNGQRGGGIITAIEGQRILLRHCTLEERKAMWPDEATVGQSEEARS